MKNDFDLELLSSELERAKDLLQVCLEEFESLPGIDQRGDSDKLALLQFALNRNKVQFSLLNSSFIALSDAIKTINQAISENAERI